MIHKNHIIREEGGGSVPRDGQAKLVTCNNPYLEELFLISAEAEGPRMDHQAIDIECNIFFLISEKNECAKKIHYLDHWPTLRL